MIPNQPTRSVFTYCADIVIISFASLSAAALLSFDLPTGSLDGLIVITDTMRRAAQLLPHCP